MTLTDTVVTWIQDNLNPEDVFDKYALKHWAVNNLNPEDIATTQELAEYVAEHCDPLDVFSEEQILAEAEAYGYVPGPRDEWE